MDYRTYQEQTAKIRRRNQAKVKAALNSHVEKLQALKEEETAQLKKLDVIYKKEQEAKHG